MRKARLWARLVGVEKAVVECVVFDEGEGAVVVSVRPARGQRRRCGVCRRRAPGYDQGDGRRRWRALDLGRVRVFVEADAPRVCCPRHGIVVAAVPWARHGAGHTLGFDQTVAWLATVCSKSRWISWARRCRLPQFVKLAQRVVRNRDAIVASIQHGLSNALVESMNTKIRLIVRVAFGFHSAEAIIALAMLSLGGHRPALPDR